MNFADRLFEQVREKESAVVVGIDPDPEQIPRSFFPNPVPAGRVRQALAKGYADFAEAVIEAVKDAAVAIKPQLAHFERLGHYGIAAYERIVETGRQAGLLVIADGKRNDIGSTAEMYAAAYLGSRDGAAAAKPSAGTPAAGKAARGSGGEVAGGEWRAVLAEIEREGPKADALTVNPYLGWDGIAPFLDRGAGASGVFVLVKTSNPSSGELQDLIVLTAAEGKPPSATGAGRSIEGDTDGEAPTVAEAVARAVEAASAARAGASGYGPVGAVVGATYPAQLARLRRLMPHVPILIPGYGAQGGTADDVAAGFDENGLGAVVNASRSILYACNKSGEPVGAASRKAAVEMRDALRVAAGRRRAL